MKQKDGAPRTVIAPKQQMKRIRETLSREGAVISRTIKEPAELKKEVRDLLDKEQ